MPKDEPPTVAAAQNSPEESMPIETHVAAAPEPHR